MMGWLISAVFAFSYLFLMFGLDFASWIDPGSVLQIALLLVGLLIGNLLSVIDRKYLYAFYGGVGKITHSVVFLAALLPVALFIVTTTTSKLGIGLIIGFELSTTVAMFADRRDLNSFAKKYLFQIARKLAPAEMQMIVGLQAVVTLLLILLVFV